MTTERKVTAGLLMGLCFMIALGGAAALSGHHLVQSARLLDHTYEALHAIVDLHIHLLLLETRARGFAMSGSEFVLEGYETDREMVLVKAREIQSLVADNPVQLARARQLAPLLENKVAFTDDLIAVRDEEAMSLVMFGLLNVQTFVSS